MPVVTLLLCGFGLLGSDWMLWSVTCVLSGLLWWALIYRGFRQRLWYAVLYPLGAGVVLFIILRAIARGRVNVRVSLHATKGKISVGKHIDVELAKAYSAELTKLAKQLKLSGEVTLDQVLRAPGVFQTERVRPRQSLWSVHRCRAARECLAGVAERKRQELLQRDHCR